MVSRNQCASRSSTEAGLAWVGIGCLRDVEPQQRLAARTCLQSKVLGFAERGGAPVWGRAAGGNSRPGRRQEAAEAAGDEGRSTHAGKSYIGRGVRKKRGTRKGCTKRLLSREDGGRLGQLEKRGAARMHRLLRLLYGGQWRRRAAEASLTPSQCLSS